MYIFMEQHEYMFFPSITISSNIQFFQLKLPMITPQRLNVKLHANLTFISFINFKMENRLVETTHRCSKTVGSLIMTKLALSEKYPHTSAGKSELTLTIRSDLSRRCTSTMSAMTSKRVTEESRARAARTMAPRFMEEQGSSANSLLACPIVSPVEHT